MRGRGKWQGRAAARRGLAIGAVLGGLLLPAVEAAASPAIERLFEQCARNLHRSADEVGVRCRHYLDFGGDDDPARRRQVQAYLDKAEGNGSAGQGWSPTPSPWRHHAEDEAVLVPDLLRREGAHRVDVVRTYGSGWEGALLRRAEAIYPVKRRTYCDERPGAPMAASVAPPAWSCGTIGALRQAGVASPAALQYYLDWTGAASDPARPIHDTVRFDRSSLVYLAGIAFRDHYQAGKQAFRRVYVAQINLGWAMTPGGGKASGFMLHKIVVFNGDGSMAAMFDDHPVNGAVWEG